MHPFAHEVLHIITVNNLLQCNENVVIGVSGGPDSTALLHVLASLRDSLRISLTALYVDHGLRPEEAAREAAMVNRYSHELHVACETNRVDAAGHARIKKLSIEHAARELRYDRLRKCADRYGATAIAVAHTADDQAEEILLRLIRGSGRKGLSGMRLKSGEIIRPLLPLAKRRVLAYLRDLDISYCEDSSNRRLDFLRNRVRHRLLPYLEKHFNPGIRKSLVKTGLSLAADEELLEELTEAALRDVMRSGPSTVHKQTASRRIDRRRFCAKPRALQQRIIEKILWLMGSRARYPHIMQIVEAAHHGRAGSEYHLSRGLRVGIFKDRLEFSYPKGKRAWRGRLFESFDVKEENSAAN